MPLNLLNPYEIYANAVKDRIAAQQLSEAQQIRPQAGQLLQRLLASQQQPQMMPLPGMVPPPPGTLQGGPQAPPPGANLAPPPGQGGGMPTPPAMVAHAATTPPPAAVRPPQIQPFQALPTVGPSPIGQGGIAPPPAAPPTALSVDEPQGIQMPQVFKAMKDLGIPPDKTLTMLEAIAPAMNMQNQSELAFTKAHLASAKAAEQFYKDQMQLELSGRRVENQEKNVGSLVKKRQVETDGGDFTPQDYAYWTEVLQKGGSLPPRLATTPGGKKLLAEVMRGVARGDVSPVDMLANQAEFGGEKAGQRTLGTRTANIEMAATEAAGLSDLALKASSEWERTGIKSLNDLEKYAQGKTASPTLRRFVAANTSFINAYARAINPQGVGTVADKEHAREMLEVGFSKGDYEAAIKQLQSEIQVAQGAPGSVKKSMRERFTGAYSGDDAGKKRGEPRADSAAPTKINSDADYEKLPSGAEFIAPDGSRRRKP